MRETRGTHVHYHLPLKLEAPAVASQGNCCVLPDATLSHTHEGRRWHSLCLNTLLSLLANKGAPGEGAC